MAVVICKGQWIPIECNMAYLKDLPEFIRTGQCNYFSFNYTLAFVLLLAEDKHLSYGKEAGIAIQKWLEKT